VAWHLAPAEGEPFPRDSDILCLCGPRSKVAQENVMVVTACVSDDLMAQMAQVIVREVEPVRIILFGSHARGEARPDSDVDEP
jgi:hypothetical protein